MKQQLLVNLLCFLIGGGVAGGVVYYQYRCQAHELSIGFSAAKPGEAPALRLIEKGGRKRNDD
jgi:hypothetical protein